MMLTAPFTKAMKAEPHSPVYTMHKYFARRPWNVFNALIAHYSSPDHIILDPFCGGGVTIVESLKLRRKAIGVDVNPLATYVTKMECSPLDLARFQEALSGLRNRVGHKISSLYATKCEKCNSEAFAEWLEWDEQDERILRLKYACPKCGGSEEKLPTKEDRVLAQRIVDNFAEEVRANDLWYPQTKVPAGDKTDSLLKQNVHIFHELFTRRNLLGLSMLFDEIARVKDAEARSFLQFAFSGSLKWASRQSHLRGEIVEGWAMHAYWIYPKSLEINVWKTFERRAAAVLRGKRYSNEHIGQNCRLAEDFDSLSANSATCLILNQSSSKLPMPDSSIDAIITDPPYGGNVNYGELSDYWFIWLSKGRTTSKTKEIVINRSQGKRLEDYEASLFSVFQECYRVLRPQRYLVSTFNSKDVRVVASFVIAASKAGFTLHPKGLLYQKPIRSYTTTFHAMQIGAFVGDFVFTFFKPKLSESSASRVKNAPSKLRSDLTDLIDETVKGGMTESELREKAYRKLIPFLATNARENTSACREAVDFFENEMRNQEQYFAQLRHKITNARRTAYGNQRSR
jgi:16S rRNA G966 N2-methylase RsmD